MQKSVRDRIVISSNERSIQCKHRGMHADGIDGWRDGIDGWRDAGNIASRSMESE